MRRIGPFGIFTGFFTIVRMDVSIVLLSVFNRPVAQSLHNTLQNCFGGDFAGEKENAFGGLSFNEFGE